jgi:hypothetical protein
MAQTCQAHTDPPSLSPQAIIQGLRQHPSRLNDISAALVDITQAKGQSGLGDVSKHLPEEAFVFLTRDTQPRLRHQIAKWLRRS